MKVVAFKRLFISLQTSTMEKSTNKSCYDFMGTRNYFVSEFLLITQIS